MIKNDLVQHITTSLNKILPRIKEIRHKLHSIPELAHHEESTASFIATELKKFGYSNNIIRMAGTGIVVLLDSNKPGKTVALRAEMDALPIQEPEESANKSINDGVMHACGHDGHMAILLAAAAILNNSKDLFTGKIKFIFQPAEEISEGSDKMICNGVLENPKVDAIFGFHNISRYDGGLLVVSSKYAMSGGVTFKILIEGEGGSVSLGHKISNPIYVGALIIQSIQSVIGRKISHSESITEITKFHAESFEDRIPDKVEIQGTIRTVLDQSKTEIMNSIENIITGIIQMFNVQTKITFFKNLSPGVNSSYETEILLETAKKILGEKRVKINDNPIMSPEDFSNYLKKIPGCFFFMGNGAENGMLHNRNYKFNDNIISDLTKVLSATAIAYLNS